VKLLGTVVMKEVIRVVLFAAGYEDARLRKPFEELAQSLRNELGKDHVRLAWVNSATPSLAEVAEEAATQGVTRLRILPLFLTPGGPLEREIPEQVAVVRGQVPGITVELLPSVGEHPRMRTLLHALAREAAHF
jgi:sirohydrochlorin cobaltochelatase